MGSVVKGKQFSRKGYISLYFNKNLVTSQYFKSATHRKEIVQHWHQKYQLCRKKDGTVYMEVAYMFG